MKKTISILLLIFLIAICSVTVCSAALPAMTEQQRFSIKEKLTAPVQITDNMENISTFSGELTYSVPELILSGKNGHDVVIRRVHNTTQNNEVKSIEWYNSDFNVTYNNISFVYLSEEGYAYNVIFESEQEMLANAPDTLYFNPNATLAVLTDREGFQHYIYERVLMPDYAANGILLTRDKSIGGNWTNFSNQECYQIIHDRNALYTTLYQGYDWCYDIPYFRDSRDSTDFSGSYNYDQYERWRNGYFRDYDGNIMEVCWGTDKNADDVRVPIYFDAKNDTGLGYKMEFISVTDIESNGLKYNRTITDNKGRIYYINESSQLIACEDKYGNRILYEDGVIIDTLGRTITLGVDGITYMDPDGYELGRIRYETDSVNNSEVDPYNVLSTDNTYVLRVYDENNKMTEYRYTMRNLLFYYDAPGKNPQSANFWGLDAYISDNGFLLTEIIFPNGDKKCYEYIETARFAGNTSIQTKYKVSRSYDITNNNQYVNDFTYTYDNQYEGSRFQHPSATIVTRVEDEFCYVDRYADQRYAEKSSRTYNHGKTITYEYRSVIVGRKFVHKETSKEGNYTTISQVNYDTNFNLIEESDGNYTATYTYDPTYNVMLTKTYNQDADTVIRVENTLTEDKKDVAISKVYENDILVSQTDYEYPIYENGYGINTDVWKEDTNRNGVKDEGEGVFTENYFHYDSMYFGDDVFSHSSYIFDITDADGINPDCHSCVTGYDMYGNIIGVEDGNYNSLTLYRDPIGRPIIQYNPDNTTQTVSYNDAENSTIYTNENGEQTITYYNLYGQVTAQYSIVENMWVIRVENFYNSIGQLSKTVSYRSIDWLDTITTKYEYGVGDRVTKISVYDKDNTLVSQEVKTYSFTPNHYIVSTKITGDDSITPATKKEYYDTVGNLVKEELVNGSEILTTTYTYDKVRNVLTVTDPNGNTTTSTYDYANRLLTQTNPQGGTVTNEYDKGGRLVATTDAMGNQSTFRYDKLDRVIEKTVPLNDLETAKHKYYYDMNSNLILEKVLTQSENGEESYQETSYVHNKNNQLTQTTVGGLLQTAYEYDPAGRTTKMLVGSTNPQITEYSYNELGQLTAVTAPDGTIETYQNDLLGNVLSKTDRNGIVTATMYNGQNLPVSVTATKDGITDTMTYTYNMLGSPVSVTNETGTISYTYDNFGRLTLETFPQNVTNAYTYDNNGNRLSYLMKIDGIEKINTAYTYNNLNQLTQVNNGDIITTYSYDANGNLLTETTGGNHSTFTYDNANRMTGLVNSYGETPRETEIYTYYPNGNKKSVTDITGKLTQYTYDNAGRLTAETVDGVVTAYTYDGYNNRIGKTNGGVHASYLYDNRNRLTKETVTENGQTAITSYQYDPNGNLYSRQTLTYGDNTIQEPKASAVLMGYTADTNDMLLEYNNFNQLTTVTKGNEIISYDYYANGMRKSKTVDGVITTHIWDGQNMAGEETQDGFVSYLRGNRLIARQMGDNVQYYHYNGHGDTSSVTDGNGTTLRNYVYDAFGNVENLHDLDTNPFRYCGEYYDVETGFIYLRNRYYDPSVGRFISEDPIRDGLNWYVYCGNNPVMFVDPTGLVVTAWDKMHCTNEEIEFLHQYTSMYTNGTSSEKKYAHEQAEKIRNKYRENGEHGFSDGNTGINGMQYSTYLWLGDNTTIKARDNPIVEFNLQFGTGLSAEVTFAGIGIEVGGKKYYDLTNIASSNPTQTLDFTVEATMTDYIVMGGSVSGTINAATREHLYNEGYAGIIIGNKVFGLDTRDIRQDFVIDFSLGGYFVVGGEVSLTINVSEFFRDIFR